MSVSVPMYDFHSRLAIRVAGGKFSHDLMTDRKYQEQFDRDPLGSCPAAERIDAGANVQTRCEGEGNRRDPSPAG